MSFAGNSTGASNSRSVDDSERRSLGMMPYLFISGSLVLAVLFVATALSVPVYMMGLHPIELAMQARGQEEAKSFPTYAVDDRAFLIEPAAGPLNQVEIDICRRVLAKELMCRP